MQYTSREVYEYISTQTRDPIVERKTCAVSGAQFPIYQSDLDFYSKISPTFAGTKFQIPTPTLCPEERSRRRLSFVNNYSLYKRKCDSSGETFISCYAPDSEYKVYTREIWWSDIRDPIRYGMNNDNSHSFTDQFDKLLRQVPHIGLYGFNNVNAPYNNGFINLKNCNMCFTVDDLEDCSYCYSSTNLKGCYDSDLAHNCEKSFQLLNCKNCFDVFFGVECEGCSNSMFIERCLACSDCFLCANLVNKSYCIQNIQYSKDDYWRKKAELIEQYGISGLEKEFTSMRKSSFGLPTIGKENSDSFGSNIYNTKSSIQVFNANNVEECKYSRYLFDSHHCQDIDIFGGGSSYMYECARTGGGQQNIMFSFGIREGSYDIWYSFLLVNCRHCFGCVGLKNKEYCIFNKQYGKDEYELEVEKIIRNMVETGERGEFFHPSLSPFGYNETLAFEHFPIKQERVLEKGYKRQELNNDPKLPEFDKLIMPAEYSDQEWAQFSNAQDVEGKIFVCELSGRPFLLQRGEIAFYKNHSLPLPRQHPQTRHDLRMNQRPIRGLHTRACDSCQKEILSIYDDSYYGKVYCEDCYKKALYV